MINLKQREQKSNMGAQRPYLILILVLFVAAALFPYGLITDLSPRLNFLVNYVFGSQIAHVIAHFGLFVLMGSGILLLFPRLQRYFWPFAALMLLLAIGQEFLQIVTFKETISIFDEVLDLTVDMLGAATAFTILSAPPEN
ncbi:MAG: hypothetical protein KC445_02615 [Anaerolineales bacterium]|nr:hypothetical protein [Anaerolineales bacterium]